MLAGTVLAASGTNALAQSTWQSGGVDNTNYGETTNWDNNTPPTGAGQSAIFDAGGSNTVVVGTAIAPDSWAFTTGAQGYSITGSTITFGNGRTLTYSAATATSIANDLRGTNFSLVANGGGTLTLSGNNGFLGNSGVTIAFGSTLALGSANALLSTALGINLNGGTLMSVLNDGTTVFLNSTSFNVSGATGGTIGGTNSLSTDDVTIAGGSILNVTSTATTTINSLTGSGSITMNASGGILAISSAGAYSGVVTLTDGTLIAGATNALGTGVLNLNGGELQTTFFAGVTLSNNFTVGANSTIGGSNNLTLSGTGTLNADLTVTSTGVTRLNGAISGNGGITMNASGGTLALTAANTYVGNTTVSAGTVTAGHQTGGIIDALGTGQITLNGGTLATTVTGTLNNTIEFSGTSGVLGAASGTTLTLSGASGPIILDTNAIATFGSTTYTGTIIYKAAPGFSSASTNSVVVGGGILQVDTTAPSDTALGDLLKTVASTTVNTGATIDFDANTTQIINNLKGSGTVNTNLGYLAGGGLQLWVNGGTSTEFSGAITGSGAIQVKTVSGSGTGKLILSGTNTYSGGTVICSCATLQIGNGGTTGSISTTGGILNDGLLIFNRSDTYSYSGLIGGSGTVEQAGGTSSITVLDATNVYSGGTKITSGTLQVTTGTIVGGGGGAIASSVGTGTVTLNGGTLQSIGTSDLSFSNNFAVNTSGGTIDANADTRGRLLTLSGVISNGNSTNGVLRLTDNNGSLGTIVLSGVNTYSGGTTITNVTAQVTNNNSLGTGAVVLNFGQLQNTQAATNITLANNFALATLAFIDSNGGTLTLSGNFTGNGLELLVYDSQGVNGKVAVTGTVNLSSGGVSICFCATLVIGNGGTTGAVLNDIANGSTLSFNRSNTYTYAGVISNNGPDVGVVRQIGTGKTILTGTSTYTGNTFVDAGTLTVNGDIRTSNAVIVNSGGTLGGSGLVPSTQISAGGTLAPGNSIGTLSVAGILQFVTGSNYAIEVSPSAADRVNVTGNAILGGATVSATYAAGSYLTKQYTILNAGSITGRFSSLVNTNLPQSVATTLSYDTNNVYLNLELLFSIPSGLNGNQQNVGNALTNYFNTNGGIPLTFAALTSNSLTQVSGQPGANIPQVGFIAMGQFINSMMDNAGSGGGQGGATGFADEDANAYAAKRRLTPQQTEAFAAVTPRDSLARTFESRWSVWATGYGGNSTISGNSATGANSTSTRVYGTTVGANYRISPDTQFGFAAGAAGTNFTVDSALGSGRADVFQFGAYARHTMGAAYLAGALAYAWQDVTTDRTLTVSGTDKLHAELKANALSARLEGGWRYGILPVAVTPYAALQSTAFYLPSYAETATSGSNQFALSYGAKTVTATRNELGARFDKSIPFNNTLLTLRGRAAWAHDWNTDRNAIATFQSLPGATFAVNGATPSANAALLSAGADIAWGNGWTVAATFDGEFSSTTRGYAGKGSVRYAW